MAESEVEKAAAEARAEAERRVQEGGLSYDMEVDAFVLGAQWSASRLSPPTREELAEWLYNMQNLAMPWADVRHLTRDLYLAYADEFFTRFSLSAPEDDWEYAIRYPVTISRGGSWSGPFVSIEAIASSTESQFQRHGGVLQKRRRAGDWLPWFPAPETGENLQCIQPDPVERDKWGFGDGS